MNIVRYISHMHLKVIENWLIQRNKSFFEDDIPEFGLLIEENGFFIAGIFLRKVEGGYGIIDGLIANPDIFNPKRKEAILKLVEAFLSQVKALGITKVIAWTSNMSTYEKAMHFGFQELRHEVLIAKEL
jgi:N-acetylglutamate synthase-like GNAT family acetyltransferase